MENWNQEDKNALINFITSGHTYDEIGILLNRTSRSIREKTRRLGITYNKKKYINRKCLCCENVIEINLNNKHDINKKFCSQSCSATYNNKKRNEIELKIEHLCLNCDKEIKSKNKYCSNKCQCEYNKKQIYKRIEDGDTTFYHTTYRNGEIVGCVKNSDYSCKYCMFKTLCLCVTD